MISKYSNKKLNWIDLEAPSEEELSHIIEQQYIPDYIKEMIGSKSKEDRVNMDNDFIFASIGGKIILVASDNFILTIHNEKIQGLEKFGKEMELDILKEDKFKIDNNKLLFAHLLKSLFTNFQDELIDSELKIQGLRNQIILSNKKNKKLKTFIIILVILLIIFICL